MGGESECAGEDLKQLKAGLPHPKGSTNGLLHSTGANHVVVLGKPEKNMLYGLASTICLNLEQKKLVAKHDQKDHNGGEMKVCK
jgi:uncharacterized NAD-dependent epimerase/dehydratase family protein